MVVDVALQPFVHHEANFCGKTKEGKKVRTKLQLKREDTDDVDGIELI